MPRRPAARFGGGALKQFVKFVTGAGWNFIIPYSKPHHTFGAYSYSRFLLRHNRARHLLRRLLKKYESRHLAF